MIGILKCPVCVEPIWPFQSSFGGKWENRWHVFVGLEQCSWWSSGTCLYPTSTCHLQEFCNCRVFWLSTDYGRDHNMLFYLFTQKKFEVPVCIKVMQYNLLLAKLYAIFPLRMKKSDSLKMSWRITNRSILNCRRLHGVWYLLLNQMIRNSSRWVSK